MITITQQLSKLTSENYVNVFYDTDLSRIYIEDWKTDLMVSNSLFIKEGRNGIDYIVIGDMNKLKYNIDELKQMDEKCLIDLHQKIFGYYSEDSEDEKMFEYLIEDLLIVDNKMLYKNHYDENSWHELDYDFIVTGYNQGDAIKVLILDDEFNWNTKKYLTNLFFDTPISGTIVFKGQEYNVPEYLYDEYDFWCKDGFIKNFMDLYAGNDRDEILEFLNHYLPEEIDYC